MAREKLSSNEIQLLLTTNKEDWKESALKHLQEILAANALMEDDDIYTLVSPQFYDDIHDHDLEMSDLLDEHYIHHLDYSREVLKSLCYIYNW